MTDEQIAEARRRWREERGWTIPALAAEYGVSYDYMRRLIKNEVRPLR
jgi:transcriptional regulator with XRE-family HTH domain